MVSSVFFGLFGIVHLCVFDQVVDDEVDNGDPAGGLALKCLGRLVAHRAAKDAECVSKQQRLRQTFDAVAVKPLLALIALQHGLAATLPV